MDDLNREKLNKEICRVHDKLGKLDPGTDEYFKVSDKLVKLTELANKDDEARLKLKTEEVKLDAEASIEAAKRGIQSEELELKAQLERERFENEMALEKAKHELQVQELEMKERLEREKLETEERLRKAENKRTWIQVGVGGGITLLTFVGTWVANHLSQCQAESFEESGHAYTSRFSRWMIREPNHPSMKV